MGINIVELWSAMGPVAKGVVVILGIMSAYSISVMIERWITYRAARKQSRVFTPAVAECLKEGKIDEAIALGEQHNKSHLAKVLISGLHELQAHSKSKEIPGETIEAAKRALERATAIGIEDLKRGLGGLATIGSVAPFVGLFGTTIGIINAFQGMRITVFSSPCPPSWPSTRSPTGSKPSRLRWTIRPPNFSIIS